MAKRLLILLAGMFITCPAFAAEDLSTYPDCELNPNKLQWITGEFRVPCEITSTVGLTLNLYKDTSDLRATATADFDGTDLTNVVCDPFEGTATDPDANACILGARVVGGELFVEFLFDGYKDSGEFDANATFELVVEGCGTFSIAQHTSCSQDILIGQSIGLTTGAGSVFYTEMCGECGITTPTGACCIFDGTECITSNAAECAATGGEYQGDGTSCDDDPCIPPTPEGACCIGDGCLVVTEEECVNAGGEYQGDDVACDPDPCPEQMVLCCYEIDGTGEFACEMLPADMCDVNDGIVVFDCEDCPPIVPTERKSWSDVKNMYR